MVGLGFIDPFTFLAASPNYMFFARDLEFTDASPDDGEDIEILKISLREALAWVGAGKITHGASVVSLLKLGISLGVNDGIA